jgi:lipoyl(octanoyl) transferase
MTVRAWRLLETGPARGAWNMAVDEALLLSVAAGKAPPTLRFYGWQPPCLSLGYFQPAAEIDQSRCAVRGIDVVRRPTGGSAILHADELTYSLAAPENDPHIAGDILTSYHRISLVLARGLADLGLDVTLAAIPSAPESPEPGEFPAAGARGTRPAPCFIRPARHEILGRGKKLVGSAQVRRAGALLQHGAIPLAGDVAAITDLLAMDEPRRGATAVRLRAAATTVTEVGGRLLASAEVAASLARAFVICWQIDLHAAPLLEEETRLAEQLLVDRYTNTAWSQAH